MADKINTETQFAIKFPCPSGHHAIEIDCHRHSLVLVPNRCPACGMGLPDAYRTRIREILNITRFQSGQQQDTDDIEIISA